MRVSEKEVDIAVSVIIPVFNAENTLIRCLESVVRQSLINEMEIVLVDDGSNDASYEMCRNFASGRHDVKLIQQRRSGVAKARNRGIECSSGRFIGFVDSDDVVDPLMYEVLLTNALDQSADMSVVGFNIQFGKRWARRYGSGVRKTFDRVQALNSFFGEYQIDASVCTKLFSREICKSVHFCEGLAYGEDRRFVFEALMASNRTIYDDRCLYHYYCTNGSAMHKPFTEERFAVLENASLIRAKACAAYPEIDDMAACYELRCYAKTYEELMSSSSVKSFGKEKQAIRDYLTSFDYRIARKHMLKRHYYAALLLKWTPRFYCALSRFLKS